MPMAIMAGDSDPVVSDRQAEWLHAAVPGSALQVVDGVGHMIHNAAQQVVAALENVVAWKVN
jgi:pimeloyl-ACP methyl ester carboxylesterase